MSIDRRDFLKLFGAALAAATLPLPPVFARMPIDGGEEIAKLEILRSPNVIEGRGLHIRDVSLSDAGKLVYVSPYGELTMTRCDVPYLETAVGMVLAPRDDGIADVRFFDPVTVRALTL